MNVRKKKFIPGRPNNCPHCGCTNVRSHGAATPKRLATWECAQCSAFFTSKTKDTSSTTPSLGLYLLKLRRQANLRMLDLAIDLQISEAFISMVETDKRAPSGSLLEHWITLLNGNIDIALKLKGNKQ